MAYQEGDFRAKACSAIHWIGSKGNNPGARVNVEFLDGPCKGQRMWWQGFFEGKTPEASARNFLNTTTALQVMGFDGDDDESVQANEWIAVVQRKEEEYEGRIVERFEIRFVNDLNRGPRFEPLDPVRVSALKQRIKGAMMASKNAPAAAKAPAEEVPEWAR